MLHRNTSKHTLGRRSLGRSRSTASISRNPVHDLVSIEPLAAERDAYIAANLSYLKAQIKEKVAQEVAMLPADPARSTLPRRNSFTLAPELASRAESIHWNHSVGGSPRLHRQQSVRFAGPHAGPRRALATRASVYSVAPKLTSLALDGTGPAHLDSEKFPLGTTSPATRRVRKHASVQNDRYTPRTSQSFLSPSQDEAALPAQSIRKLRKSRSMYTASLDQRPTHHLALGSGSGSGDRLREWLAMPGHTLSKENKSDPPQLKAPRSMSFLRQSNNGTTRSYAEQELAARLAQADLRSNASFGRSATLKPQQSSFFKSRSKRPQSSSALPRTLRNSSEHSAMLSSAFSGDTVIGPRPAGLRTTARKVSRSFRSRIMGLFSRPKSIDYPVDDTLIDQADGESCLRTDGPILSPQGASVSRVPSHLPSFHAVPLNQQLKSRQGSFEIVKGEDQPNVDDKSRVTSWTTSTVNTVESQEVGTQSNWEDRHIAAIREIGAHASPAAQGVSSRQLKGTSWGARGNPPPPLVDSQRVYSALLKRLGAANGQGSRLAKQAAEAEPSRAHRQDSLSGSPAVKGQPRRSQLRDGSSTTIRCVRDDDDVFREGSTGSALVQHASASASSESVIRIKPPSANAQNGPKSSPAGKEIRTHLEPPKALPTRSSAFFGSPTCHLFRTASPYRRALRESMRSSQDGCQDAVNATKYMGSLSALSLPTRCLSPEESRRDCGESCAESVYSFSSSPKQSSVENHVVSSTTRDSTDLSADEHGAATIYVNPAVYKLNLADAHKRHVSTASSVEWKTWLSANVSKLEVPESALDADFPEDPEHARRRFGHVREEAEIEPDGGALEQEEEGGAKPTASPVALPLRLVENPISVHSTPVAGLPSPGEVWRRKSQAFDENTPPACSEKVSPLIPSRTSLCNVSSGSNVNAAALVDSRSRNAAELPRMKSLSSLGKSSPIREELLQKRRSRTRLRMGESTKSSPGLTVAVERQFANGKTGSPAWARPGRLQNPPAGQSEAATSADGDEQGIGSKRMVDLFLSSRRKRIGSGTRQSSESFGEAAFI